jgi:type IV fimbrial biogenesis protein FimT
MVCAPAVLAPVSAPEKADRGFTLVELLVVLAISAILAAAAVPGFNRIVIDARLSEASAALRGAIELARSEAMARSARVGVCRSELPNAAIPSCSNAQANGYPAADWAIGWIVYQKAPANLADVFEAGDTLIRRQPQLGAATAGSRVVVWAAAPAALVYNWNGIRASGPAGGFALDFGMASLSARNALISSQAVCLGINVVGRIDHGKAVAGACA